MANATPEGIHLEYGSCLRVAYVLNPATSAKMTAKINMKTPLCSGSCPSPVSEVRYMTSVDVKANSYEVDVLGLAKHMPWVQGTKVPGWCMRVGRGSTLYS